MYLLKMYYNNGIKEKYLFTQIKYRSCTCSLILESGNFSVFSIWNQDVKQLAWAMYLVAMSACFFSASLTPCPALQIFFYYLWILWSLFSFLTGFVCSKRLGWVSLNLLQIEWKIFWSMAMTVSKWFACWDWTLSMPFLFSIW